ncbi:APC family permease [Ectopseudomonas hydrolytica]|uniref:APC family permease n=1 Tax=Ectopseudomonas hydrolytica TaxID=2493633 RepID=UPI0018A6D805|nr:amino acid permease [Pseudomonas hydrolytica]MBF8163255.1 amino acid permease [Pseudomonas mendocina]UTH30737.1 amino acid permease [Pseudomonas hydrolytica]UZZ09945.1 amino acid permease [Pseudomonas mendocina]
MTAQASPRAGLSVVDGVAMLAGVVIGVGIFGLPPLVAQHASSAELYLALWLAGGLVMLIGALCYGELGAAHPDQGGEYHYLSLAWGPQVGLLFAWARGTVIQTGAIAVVAFIYGDYAQRLLPLEPYGSAWHAASVVVALTLLNLLGTRESRRAQVFFSAATVASILLVILAGLALAEPQQAAAAPPQASGSTAAMLGMGMVFVLLTYGGWNEAAYLSGELRNPARNMSRVLLIGTALVTALYLLANLVFLDIFGLDGLRQTDAVAADLMHMVAGPRAEAMLALFVCLTALSTLNATIFTGSRVYYALGRDVPQLAFLGRWNERGATPLRALLLQCAITLPLILFGALSENGVQTMVAYTAPVFWLFMSLTALALIRLRRSQPWVRRPFSVPLYPLTPILFALTCLGLFYSSTLYAGSGALLGLLVLAAGAPLLLLQRTALQEQPDTAE